MTGCLIARHSLGVLSFQAVAELGPVNRAETHASAASSVATSLPAVGHRAFRGTAEYGVIHIVGFRQASAIDETPPLRGHRDEADAVVYKQEALRGEGSVVRRRILVKQISLAFFGSGFLNMRGASPRLPSLRAAEINEVNDMATTSRHVFGRTRPSEGGQKHPIKTKPKRDTEFRDLPAPTGPAPFHLDLNDILPKKTYDTIVSKKKLAFHFNGGMGGVRNGVSQKLLAKGVEADFDPAKGASENPAFLYIVGDCGLFQRRDEAVLHAEAGVSKPLECYSC